MIARQVPRSEWFAIQMRIAHLEAENSRLKKEVETMTNQMNDFEMVEEFIDKFEHSNQPELWFTLVEEEYEELQEALEKGDMIALLDAICDLKYVLNGLGSSLGMQVDKAYAEVHRSNMTKLGADGKPIKREDGKILKGPFFEEPELAQFINSPLYTVEEDASDPLNGVY